MPSLKEMVGQSIVIRSLALDERVAVTAKLVAIEDAGLWLESKSLIEEMLAAGKASMSPRTPLIFVPFAHIAWILGIGDYPAISGKLLGADKP